MTENPNLNQRIIDYGFLPGGDLAKTIIFIVLIFIVFFLLCGPFHPTEIPEKSIRITSLLFVISIVSCLISAAFAYKLLNLKISELKHSYKLLIPKTLLSLGVIILFSIICYWVLHLGGILKSPFGSILVISPLFLTLEFIRWKDKNKYHLISQIINKDKEDNSNKGKLLEYLNYINIFVILLVLSTTTIGEMVVKKYDIQFILCANKIEYIKIISSNWCIFLGYFFYYFSLLCTFISILSPDTTRELSKKIFT
ncbi:hypothetical protein D4R71_06765 [bacterium]|nr:MAG: hypothetical protein D4R71_06765 [bacterium]